MQVSERLRTLTGDGDGWGVFYRAREMVARGERVTELTIGEHDIPTHPRILAEMARAAAAGHTVKTTRGNILITPGGQAALFAAHMAACNPGDRALFIDPYYATYPGTIRAAGALPVPIAARAEDGFQPRAEDIAAKAENAASLMINTPNNPTGAVYGRDTLEAIAGLCRERGIWLISDEVYDTMVWQGEHLSPRALPGMADHVLVAGSMSKSHAMTGSRIGWIAGPEEAISALIDLATHTTYGVPGYIQDAALFALDEGSWLEDEVSAPFRRRRALALEALARQEILRVVPADGAMYLMLDVRACGLSGTEFALRLLEAHHIAVMPGESFGQAAAGHVRVALTVEDAALVAALERIADFAAILCREGVA